MSIILRVGDPHVKINNLEESHALMNFVLETAKKEKVDRIELLGDLHHSHDVVRLKVLQFWEYWLTRLSNELESTEVVVLVGNHDISGDYNSEYSALTVFSQFNSSNLHIITKPQLFGNIGYISYVHDNDIFIKYANILADSGAIVLVCHQTLMGSKYESGIYAHDGIDSERISKNIRHIISGHIHSTQEFGRIDYPGTARWDSASDANLSKGIWIYRHDDITGYVLEKRFISTETVCTPMLLLSYKEGAVEPKIPEKSKITIELIGSSDWISKEKLKFKGKAKIQTRITDTKKIANRQTGSNFEDFVKNIFTTNMDRNYLLSVAKELGIV